MEWAWKGGEGSVVGDDCRSPASCPALPSHCFPLLGLSFSKKALWISPFLSCYLPPPVVRRERFPSPPSVLGPPAWKCGWDRLSRAQRHTAAGRVPAGAVAPPPGGRGRRLSEAAFPSWMVESLPSLSGKLVPRQKLSHLVGAGGRSSFDFPKAVDFLRDLAASGALF